MFSRGSLASRAWDARNVHAVWKGMTALASQESRGFLRVILLFSLVVKQRLFIKSYPYFQVAEKETN